MLDMLKKQNSSSASDEEDMSIDKFANLSKNLNKPQMMTASVSIAPVKQEQKVIEDNLVQSDEETPKNKGNFFLYEFYIKKNIFFLLLSLSK